MWTANALLDRIQDLLGEPYGSFYNLSSRLTALNVAQREMVAESRALPGYAEFSLDPDQREVELPEDFLTFSKEDPYVIRTDGTSMSLDVKDPKWVEARLPGWRTNPGRGTPTYAVKRGRHLILSPVPDNYLTLSLPYIVAPLDMTGPEDLPFNGDADLNRFAIGLAYHVAHILMLPRAPAYAQQLQQLYVLEERKMRDHVRSNPQHAQTIRPIGLRGY
jgi:hypothetical protein